MYKCAYDRIQDSRDGKYDCDKVQNHRKCQIAFDSNHHSFGQSQKMGDFPDIIIHKSNVCCIDSNVASDTAHGDADKGLFQCGCVIDAVSDHADRKTLILGLLDPV